MSYMYKHRNGRLYIYMINQAMIYFKCAIYKANTRGGGETGLEFDSNLRLASVECI